MAKAYIARIRADAREVHKVLTDGMEHVELISEDVFNNSHEQSYVAVLLYEQFFMRVGNQLALMLVVSGTSQTTVVKSVACAGSKDMLMGLDMGAAGDFAAEPINLLNRVYSGRVSTYSDR